MRSPTGPRSTDHVVAAGDAEDRLGSMWTGFRALCLGDWRRAGESNLAPKLVPGSLCNYTKWTKAAVRK